MSFSITYRELFRINILHLYFLNKGNESWLTMSEDEKEKQLSLYDFNNVFSLEPSADTIQKIKGHQLVHKNLKGGMAVWAKADADDQDLPFINLDDDLFLTFLLRASNPAFLNFTGLEIDTSNGLFYFSNRRLATEAPAFPLINQAEDDSPLDETFVLTELSKDEELKKLSDAEKKNLFGLIRIYMKGDDNALDITDGDGKLLNPVPAFEVIFDNRKTIWRYIFKTDQTVIPTDDVEPENGDARILITKDEQPLSFAGFVSVMLGDKELPNPGSTMIKPVDADHIYSEIFM